VSPDTPPPIPPETPPEISPPGVVARVLTRASGLTVDLTPLRLSRDFRLLWTGQSISDFGSHISMVAAPFQVFQLTHSSLAVGLLGLCWLGPLLSLSLLGGAIADAVDRRKLLRVSFAVLPVFTLALAVNAVVPHPHVWPLYTFSTLTAAAYAIYSPAARSLPPRLLPKELLPSAFALETMSHSLGALVGPAVAGVLIAAFGLGGTYLIEAAFFLPAIATLTRMRAVPPAEDSSRAGLESIREGFRFLRGRRVLQTTFTIDLNAMIFGMPEALFPAFAHRLGGGATTVGLLYAAPSAGAFVATLLSGRARHVRRQGLACMVAVVVWGAAIAAFGLSRATWLALLLLVVAGAADLVSGIYRSTILQTSAPDAMRGRLSGIELAVVATGPSIGDLEAGVVGSLVSVPFAIVSGGLACVAGVAVLAFLVPQFVRYDARDPTP
jgi:MFS family permease